MKQTAHNVRPRLTVNIGITGHRHLAPKLETKLRKNVSDFLQTIKKEVQNMLDENSLSLVRELYSPEPPRYVLLSSLSYGADSLVAEEALKLGYELHVPLPFAQAEYEKDFDTPERLSTFRKLLEEAKKGRVFEISAANPVRGRAYEDAARVLLNHSDVLLALWDGSNTEYVSGTAAAIRQAAKQHIPVIHIHSDGVTPSCIITNGIRRTDWREELRKHLVSLLLPVEATPPKSELKFVHSCARQDEIPSMGWSLRGGGIPSLFIRTEKLFSTILRLRPIHALLRGLSNQPNREEQEEKSSKVAFVGEEDVFAAHAPKSLSVWSRLFDRFDALANAYSARYRSGLLWRYLAPVLATLFLAFALNWEAWNSSTGKTVSIGWVIIVWFVLQVVCLGVPVLLQRWDCRWMWHRKFFSYRVVSEQLRQTKFLGPVGYAMVHERESTYKDSPQRWTAWYYRALMRAEGLPHAVVDRTYLRNWLLWTRDRMVVDQMNYHEKRSSREGRMCIRLVRLGMLMFFLGLIAAFTRGCLESSEYFSDSPIAASIHSFFSGAEEQRFFKSCAAAGALFIPAAAVFFAGFCAYACYAKDQQVSVTSSNTLDTIRKEMDVFLRAEGYAVQLSEEEQKAVSAIIFDSLNFSHAYNFAEQINDCCKSELLGWEDLISTKGIKHL